MACEVSVTSSEIGHLRYWEAEWKPNDGTFEFGTLSLVQLALHVVRAVDHPRRSQNLANRPQAPVIAIPFMALIVYLVQTRFLTGAMSLDV